MNQQFTQLASEFAVLIARLESKLPKSERPTEAERQEMVEAYLGFICSGRMPTTASNKGLILKLERLILGTSS